MPSTWVIGWQSVVASVPVLVYDDDEGVGPGHVQLMVDVTVVTAYSPGPAHPETYGPVVSVVGLGAVQLVPDPEPDPDPDPDVVLV